MKLYVFTTSRSQSEFFQQKDDSFLPKSTLAVEFFSKVIITKGLCLIPSHMKNFLLLEAIKEIDFDSRAIFFEKNFLGFLESSPFLFSFFDELHQSLVDINSISTKDTYGEYQDHLNLLERLHSLYTAKLEKYGFYDKAPNNYEIFEDYIKSFEAIEFHLDGFLSKFELEILKKLSALVPINLHFTCDKYNINYFNFFTNQPELSVSHSFSVSFPSGDIISSKPLEISPNIEFYAFSLRISQTALVFAKIQEWLKEGIPPEKIAVILPNEDFARYLMLFDECKNLNYAMGFPLKQTKEFKALVQECDKIQGSATQDLTFEQKIQKLQEFITPLKDTLADKATPIDKILFDYSKAQKILSSTPYPDLLKIFLEQISSLRLDDNSGGKIRVIGALEARGISLEGAIIPDFEGVPNINDSDMFLNTKIRKAQGMITLQDRISLQRHYYLSILQKTKKVAISFVGDPSSLDSFIPDPPKQANLDSYTLRPYLPLPEYKEDLFVDEIPQDFSFSYSSLATFTKCKRKFFFYYLKRLRRETPSLAPNIGKYIHDILESVYKNEQPNLEALALEVEKKLKDLEDILEKTTLESIDFQAFIKTEKAQKLHILGTEVAFEKNIFGLKFCGRVDRIDTDGLVVNIIDYKVRKNFKLSIQDYLQAILYFYAFEDKYPDLQVYFYDVLNGSKQKIDLDSKPAKQAQELLLASIEELKSKIEFSTTQDLSICKDCLYSDLCGK